MKVSSRMVYERIKANGDLKGRVTLVRSTGAENIYVVDLPEGYEIKDQDLVAYCDYGKPNFGGEVKRSGNRARVTVYTD